MRKRRKTIGEKRKIPIFVVIGLVLFFAFVYFYNSKSVQAANPPAIITYQGKLLISNVLATTTQSMYFILYDALSGGNILYTASGTVATPLSVSTTPTQGLFSINLGDTGTNSLDPTIFQNNASVYLEVRVGSDTLTPRKRLTAAPYAFNAKYLDGVGTATNSTTTYIPVSDASGNFTFNSTTISTTTVLYGATLASLGGRVGIGTSSPIARLTVLSAIGDTNVFDISSSTGGSLLRVTAGGRVGIGTTTPAEKLDVVGNISNITRAGTTLSQIASVSVGLAPRSVFVSGKYAYTANFTSNTISVVDISNPSSPIQISTTSVDVGPQSIYVSGKYAYVANNTTPGVLSVVDISNPASPVQIATTSVGNSPRSVYVSGKFAYTANAGPDNISVVDISNPTSPIQIATVSVDQDPLSIYVSGRYAYTANYSGNTISVVDISNPLAPTQVATTSVGDGPYSIYVSGRYAYVANSGLDSISVVDISNPSAPIQIATTSVGNNPYSIFVSGRYAYVANGNDSNISIVDISSSSSPFQITTVSVGSNPFSVFVSGRYAYVANGNAISIVDISGTEVTSLIAHSAEVGNIQSRNDIFAQGNIMAGTSFMVGAGGIMSQGALSVYASSTGATSSIFSIDSAQKSNILKVLANGDIGIGTSTPSVKLSVVGTAGNNDVLDIASSTGASMLRVTANGNVGINTSSPIARLAVLSA
ncbi:MAG: hypothetical protein AAB348_03975, partial [Patescibacteria group bacterium]